VATETGPLVDPGQLIQALRIFGVDKVPAPDPLPDKETDAMVTLALSNLLLTAVERQVLYAEAVARAQITSGSRPGSPRACGRDPAAAPGEDLADLLRWRAARLTWAIRNISTKGEVMTTAARVADACSLLLECEAALNSGKAHHAPDALLEASDAVHDAVHGLRVLTNRPDWP